MTRLQIWYMHVTVLLTTITGAVFAAMKYFMKSDDEFAVVNHPLQPAMFSAHVVIAPLLLFGLGWTFGNHIWPRYKFAAKKRKSGITSMLLIVPMVLSAYLLQIATNETLRQAMAAAHWISSAAFVIGYAIHVLVAKAT
ncbi:MAG TPA: hypothetical protein VFN10_12910 [Thermoanaerobaculia bacterium]|nr:hypothetical protein [Thermoanaerobaculia bacterium]